MRAALIITSVLLAACAEDSSVELADLALDSRTTDASAEPTTCKRIDTVAITDLNQAATGFNLAPIDLVEGATGWFEGDMEGVPGAVDGNLEIDDALGQVRAIYQEGEDCTNYYEIAFAASLAVGDDLLATSFAAILQARSHDDVRFAIRLPEYELDGTLVPRDTMFTEDSTDLRVSGRYLGHGAWEGELDWTFQDQAETIGSFAFYAD